MLIDRIDRIIYNDNPDSVTHQMVKQKIQRLKFIRKVKRLLLRWIRVK